MKIRLRKDNCIGCGICEEMAPQLFEMGDYEAEIIESNIKPQDIILLKKVQKECPAGSIILTEEDD